MADFARILFLVQTHKHRHFVLFSDHVLLDLLVVLEGARVNEADFIGDIDGLGALFIGTPHDFLLPFE